MKVDLTTDIRIIALQSAALRLENILSEGHVAEPELLAQVDDLAQKIRRQISILKLQAPDPKP